MEGNEENETLSNSNKPSELEVEETRRVELLTEFEESTINVVGEDMQVGEVEGADGERNAFENTVKANSDLIMGIVSEGAVMEEGVGVVSFAASLDPKIDIEAEDQSERVGDGRVTTSISDAVDAAVLSESKLDSMRDEAILGPVLKSAADEGSVTAIVSNLEMIVSDVDKDRLVSELPTYEGAMNSLKDIDHMEMDRGAIDEIKELEIDVPDSLTMDNDSKMAPCDKDDLERVDIVENYLGFEVAEKSSNFVEEKFDPLITKEMPTSEVEIVTEPVLGDGDDKKPFDIVEEQIDQVPTREIHLTEVENDYEMAVGHGDGEDKIDILANFSELEYTEKSSGIKEENIDQVIPKQITAAEFSIGMDPKTDMNTNINHVIKDEGITDSFESKVYSGTESREPVVKTLVLAAKGSLTFETKSVKDENNMVEGENNSEFDSPVDSAENNDVAPDDEEHLSGNTGLETTEGMGSGLARNEGSEDSQLNDNAPDDEEHLSGNTGLETTEGLGSVLARNEGSEDSQLNDLEMDSRISCKLVAHETPMTSFGIEDTRIDMLNPDQEMDDSVMVPEDEGEETSYAVEIAGTRDTEIETENEVNESGKGPGWKRRRGRLPKSSSISKSSVKYSSKKTGGEDVCFICFDGGELVVCDRRGCRKAYHTSCVNRDEAFFRAKGRWNCGWHMCSVCEKNANFLCYTCTFSLCKRCSKDAIIFCVRGNKGFCETCMRTVKLIETNEDGNKDSPVDFDDKGNWEHLFKDYYIELKSKLSLSTEEVAKAKHPWKGASAFSDPIKQESSDAQPDTNGGGSSSNESVENLNIRKPRRKKLRKQSKSSVKGKKAVSSDDATGDKIHSSSANSDWASKELLEFVSHMKNGDISILSQFDVQSLLLEYIKRNKLRDPRRKSQIICDARLEILFGKPRVGHFEMLKLLESHFLVRDELNEDVRENNVDTENNQLDIDSNVEQITKGMKDRKRKTRKKGIREPQSNLDDYAAIDMHNISLIYLRRKLMEDLLEDAENFHDKVVGMFVRIRIVGSQKQDLYRLVQVVGTSKGAEPYKIGKKSSDIMVEILNLDKIEVISIDTISNQEFTEEECKRLRQSIKCGLISRLTVGEILDKTMEIQAARVNDWLESETLRLSHLRDRASDLGRRKELRECVEKLHILKTPEERNRRMQEIPEVHSDPKMDPSYESDDNEPDVEENTRDDFVRSKSAGFSKRSRTSIIPEGDSSVRDSWGSPVKASTRNRELSRNLSGNNAVNSIFSDETANENRLKLENDREHRESFVSRAELISGVPSITSQTSLPSETSAVSVPKNEAEKKWHYQDPSGKVQGPFSMVQLRKWSNTGYFPTDLKIWRTSETQNDSILMSDALAGKFHKELSAARSIFPTTDTLHISTSLATHSSQISGSPLQLDRERLNVSLNPESHLKLPTEKGNIVMNLPSPTPKQSISGWNEKGLPVAIQSSGVKGSITSAIETQPVSPHANVLNAVDNQTSNIVSQKPNSQLGLPVASADPLHIQPFLKTEPHAQMRSHLSAEVQPVQNVINQNHIPEDQGWGSSAQSVHSQGYGWPAPNIQSSASNFAKPSSTSTVQSDFWRNAAGQPNFYPSAAPNTNWGIAPAEDNSSLGMKPENPNGGWGMVHAGSNMGMGNPVPGNTNMIRGPPMPPHPIGSANSGWVAPAPSGNVVANVQAPFPGNVNSGWAATPSWVLPPVQGVPGNEWDPMNINARAPTPVQNPAQGTTNQIWGAPPRNQGGPWSGQQNHNGAQFSGHMNGHGRDSGFSGGRPWSNQSSFGGGGPGGQRPFNKREMVCPYNTNGRCRKGGHCDYLHI